MYMCIQSEILNFEDSFRSSLKQIYEYYQFEIQKKFLEEEFLLGCFR